MSEKDYQRLHGLVQAQRLVSGPRAEGSWTRSYVQGARVLDSREIPTGGVTMSSPVKLRVVKILPEINVNIVFPKDQNLPN